MRLFQYGEETARQITQFGSKNVGFIPVARPSEGLRVALMEIQPSGVVGYHQAVGNQLFMILRGTGWVTGEDRRRVAVSPGFAALWVDGEWHESGSDEGMLALVIEGESLEPPPTMIEAEPNYLV